MVSDKFIFAHNSPDAARIPLKIEEFAQFSGLSATNSRLLSLLSEEMIGMVKAILPDFSADITVENNRNKYDLILTVSAVITTKDRDKLLEASGGKNSAYGKGLLGKIGDMFVNWAITLNDNPLPLASYTDMELGSGMGMVNGYEEWSMRVYLDSIQNKTASTPETVDDGLERSIIVKLADDCKVSVKSGSVVMTVSKTFEETGFTQK
jgi:hypothetical protein